MLALGIYELTHPESLSESELKEILENRCIDFSNYKNLSKSELIELYKRVALPLPQRSSENTQNLDTKRYNEATYSINESHRNSVSLPKSSANEIKQSPKKIRLNNSNNVTKCNGIDKRINDDKYDEAPSKKRQKITWP